MKKYMKKEKNKSLISGKYSIKDLINVEKLQAIFEKFTQTTGFTIGFLDHPGLNVLIATGWRDICTKFHRACPASLKNCKKSNEHLLEQLTKPKQLVVEPCDNGLVDCATPIIINGKHVASLATGQLLLEKPDIERFKKQAKMYNYDEEEYLKALKEIPVVSKEKLKNITAFLGELAVVISEEGYIALEAKDKAEKLEKEIEERKKIEKKLQKMSLVDSQTGLYNHRYLIEAIEKEFHRFKREARPFSIIMIDIDYFKSINDVYGHKFGDFILKQFGDLLKKTTRRYDIIARFGGEEFVIIISDSNRAKATLLAQRLLSKINMYNFGNKKHKVKLKLSMGISSCPEDKVTKGMGLVEFADRILNKAKNAGGNRAYSSLDLIRRKQIVLKETGHVKSLREKIDKLNKRGSQSTIEAVFAFAKTIDIKDHLTGKHSEKAVLYSGELARRLNLPENDIENIKQAVALHDLGKIGISDKVLGKKRKTYKKRI